MAQPAAGLPQWDSNAVNVSPTTNGHKLNGAANSEIPTSAEWNYWMNLVYLWCQYLLALLTMTRTKFPLAIQAVNWASSITAPYDKGPWLAASGAGDAYVDLDIPQGYKLSTLTLFCIGNAAANLTITVLKALNVNTISSSLGALVLNALSATPADQVLNMLAVSTTNTGGQTVAVTNNGGGFGLYTRSAGSYITDGFFIGQIVTWSGFVNGGNNGTFTITGLTATAMTTNNAGFVVETSSANAALCVGVSPAIDSTFALQLKLTASATGLGVKSLRYTCVPQ